MKIMNIEQIIRQYYRPGTALYDIFMDHAEHVAQKSIDIALRIPHLNPDTEFIQEAAMLHDIGIFMTHSPSIHCTGEHPYVCHGLLGRELMDSLGFPRHGLVCERHTGAGITAENIINNNLPLPCRDMVPVTIEEEIICFADKFYSKRAKWKGVEKSIDRIMDEMLKLDRLNSKYRDHPAKGLPSCFEERSNRGNISHSERFSGWIEKFLMH